MKLLEENLIIPETQGSNTIPKAKGFSIDSDFTLWKADEPSKDTKSIKVNVFELDENKTFKEIFTDPERQCLTQSQILSFIKNHKEWLRKDGYATFFLFKSGDNFFVARAHFDVSGRLKLYVFRLSHGCVWDASRQHRVVVPATNFKILDTNSLDSLSRIEKLEEDMDKIKKFLII